MKIGMRNVKTAISVFLSLVISKLLKFEYPFYAAIAAVIAMQGSVSSSFKAGKNRMLGTFIGASVGLLLALIRPGNVILCGIGIIIVIYLCNLLKWNNSVSIACVVFLAIMVNLKGGSPLFYSFNRLVDTFVGIGVAVLVNYFISPPDYMNKIIKSCSFLKKKTDDLVKERICLGRDINLETYKSEILSLEKMLGVYISESRQKTDSIDKINDILEIYRAIYNHLKIIYYLHGPNNLNHENFIFLCELYGLSIEENAYEKTDENIIFNYHIKEIIDRLNLLNRLLPEVPSQ